MLIPPNISFKVRDCVLELNIHQSLFGPGKHRFPFLTLISEENHYFIFFVESSGFCWLFGYIRRLQMLKGLSLYVGSFRRWEKV